MYYMYTSSGGGLEQAYLYVYGEHTLHIYIYTYIYTYIFSFAVAYFTCYEVLRQMQTRRRVLEAWFVQQRRLRIELSCC